MPLVHSASNEARSENISREMHAHPEMKPEQAQAIAYSVQREARAHDEPSEHTLAEIGKHELAEHSLEHKALHEGEHYSATSPAHSMHEHDETIPGPYGSRVPGRMDAQQGHTNRVETMHDDRGYMQVGGSLAEITRAAAQMWGENVHDPENENGVVTKEGHGG